MAKEKLKFTKKGHRSYKEVVDIIKKIQKKIESLNKEQKPQTVNERLLRFQ